MSINKAAQDHMKAIFTEGFSAGDIAEPLVSFDATAPTDDAVEVMDRHGFEVVGVRRNGLIAGYVRREDLNGTDCGEHLRSFDDARVVAESACLPTLVGLLSESSRVFVTLLGRVGAIVTRSDLQKPPVRMWLFGMVTMIEMGITRLIEARFPEESWRKLLSEGRVEKAEVLLAERKRRNQDLGLIDCLQFSDKGQITLKDPTLREQVGYRSRNKGEETIKLLEALRNNLAHSQDIIARDWDTIVRLTENFDKILAFRARGLTT